MTRLDYESILIPAVEHALAQHKQVRLYYQIDPGFPGIEPGTMGDDFTVGMAHLFRWEGLAVATDVEWVRSRWIRARRTRRGGLDELADSRFLMLFEIGTHEGG